MSSNWPGWPWGWDHDGADDWSLCGAREVLVT
jgi:hypothetical protein